MGPLIINHPFLIEYIDDNNNYNILSILNNNNVQLTQSGELINSGYNHWTSKLNHSCSPNCIIKPFRNNDNKISLGLFTINDIKKGDELTIDYKWFSYDGDLCKEAICLCGLSDCKGTYIQYKNMLIEDDYLFTKHKYI